MQLKRAPRVSDALFLINTDGSQKPIAHVSSAFGECVENYAQFKKEALVLVFAVGKFYKYVYGRDFLLLTDYNRR